MLKHIPTILISSIIIRILFTGASIGDALAIIGLSGLYGYQMWLDTKRQIPVNKAILDRIVYLEENIMEAKGKISAIALSQAQRR